MDSQQNDKQAYWFVMRDLKCSDTKQTAYKQLEDNGGIYPMKSCIKIRNSKCTREKVPFIQDLLFVHDSRKIIDPIVDKTPTLQYRYKKGGGYCNPMTVGKVRRLESWVDGGHIKFYSKRILTELLESQGFGVVRFIGRR